MPSPSVFVARGRYRTCYHRDRYCWHRGYRNEMDEREAHSLGLRPCETCYSPKEIEAAKTPADRAYEAFRATL